MKLLVIASLLVATTVGHAQDQLMVRFNQSGILSLMDTVLKYNQRGQAAPGFKIPQGLYSLKVKKADLVRNPVVQLISEVSDLNLMQDLPFYVYNSNISVVGDIDRAGLRSAVSNYSAEGFDLRITFSVPNLRMNIPEIALCEKKAGSQCGNGLKASFRNSSIALRRGSVIRVTGDFRVSTNNQQARLRLVRATTNLGAANGPRLDINPGTLSVPPITITVNGESAQLDTSSLRGELLKHTGFLANKMLGFAADFIAEDLAAMVNKALKKECVPTQLNVLTMEPRPVTGRPLVVGMQKKADFGTLLQRDVAKIIKSARFDLNLKSIRTPESKHLEIRADGSLNINGQRWQVGNRIGNSTRTLPALNVDALMPNDQFGVVVSEPVLNSSLALLSGTGLFQQLIDTHVDTRGLYVTSAHVYFRSNPDRFYVLVGTQVKLKEINSDGVLSWIKNWFAAWFERDNNNSVLYFPMQFEIIPRLVRAADGSAQLMLRVNSPFAPGLTLRNYFNHTTNITQATDSVREGVVKELQKSLGGYVNREFAFPLAPYLNQKGLSFNLKNFKVVDNAYLMVSFDLNSLNLANLERGQGGSCR